MNGTWAAFAGDASRWLDGRLRTLAGAGTGLVNLDFYGLGLDRPSFDQKVRYSLQFNGAVVQTNWQLGPKSPWAIGLRYVFADVDPKLRDQPAFPGLTDRVRVKISAPTAIVEYDSRDSVFTPTRPSFRRSLMDATPCTTVQKMIGAIIILTSLMKPSPSGFSDLPSSGKKPPITIPRTTAISTCR